MFDTWKTHVTLLGPCSLNSWWNSTPFLYKALVCRSSRTRVRNLQKIRTIFYTKMKKTCLTREIHMSRVWNHVHWICGKILSLFDVRHVHLCHLEQELEILQKFGTLYCTKMKNTCQTREIHVKYTCHVYGTISIEFLVKFYPIFM